MRSNRSVTTLLIGGLLALTSPVLMNPNKADANEYVVNQCRQSVFGTYLSTANQTNSNSGQPSSFREIITFSADGNLIANDSNASGVPGSSNPADQPFGSIQGTWKCTGNNEIVAKALAFSFASGSLPGNIALGEFHLTFNPQTRAVNGKLTISNFYDLNSNPLAQNTQPLPGGPFEYSYQGVKLKN